MIKPKPRAKSPADDGRERQKADKALDEALKDTFPASDPISIEQPAPGREPPHPEQ